MGAIDPAVLAGRVRAVIAQVEDLHEGLRAADVPMTDFSAINAALLMATHPLQFSASMLDSAARMRDQFAEVQGRA